VMEHVHPEGQLDREMRDRREDAEQRLTASS